MCEKNCIWNPNDCTSENRKYSISVIGDSVITGDKVTEATKTISTKVTEIRNFFIFTRFFINYHIIFDNR